jgi:hypothetical protein
LSAPTEYVIDGNTVNKLLESYNLEAIQPTSQLRHMLPGQVFDLIEKKFVKGLLDEIDKSKAQTVRFVNLEAIASGPHKDYLYAICGGLEEMMVGLAARNLQVIGTVQYPLVLPWSLAAKLDKTFKGLSPPGETTPE